MSIKDSEKTRGFGAKRSCPLGNAVPNPAMGGDSIATLFHIHSILSKEKALAFINSHLFSLSLTLLRIRGPQRIAAASYYFYGKWPRVLTLSHTQALLKSKCITIGCVNALLQT